MVAFAELDERVPFGQQLGQDEGPIVFFNTFHVALDEVDAFMDAWKADGEFMKRQPGYISTQLHRGIAGSTTFINVAEWESVAAFRAAASSPEFQANLSRYPHSAVASPFQSPQIPGTASLAWHLPDREGLQDLLASHRHPPTRCDTDRPRDPRDSHAVITPGHTSATRTL